MAPHRDSPGDGSSDHHADPRWWERDEDRALARLEDVLLSHPFDRALPDLGSILTAADVSEELLRRDDRAVKLLHEAVVARPLGSADAVARLRTEVELLTLEVEVLTDRLHDPHTEKRDVRRAQARLVEVRRRLDEIQTLL